MITNAADLLEQAPDGIVVHDGEHIVAVNAAMLRLAGAQQRDQVVGQRISTLFEHPHLKGVERELVLGRRDDAAPRFVRERLYGVDGTVHVVEAHAHLFLDGDRPAVCLVVHDLRERIASEHRAQQQLDALRTTDSQMSARKLAGGVAHVINNRLQAIIGFADLLAQESLTGQQRLDLDQVMQAAVDGAEVTRQLLQAASSASYSPVRVQLDRMVRSLVEESVASAGEPLQAVIETVPAIHVDAVHTGYILSYLLANARRATREFGRITLTVRPVVLTDPQMASHGERMPSGRYATVSLQDTGVGMSAEAQFRMFDPFFSTAPIGQGNGLGLSAVQGLLQQNGGFLTFASTSGVGSTFTVWFPEAGGPVSEAPVDVGETPRVVESILMIDEESAPRSAMVHCLETAGFRVLQLDTIMQASEVIARIGCPSLVILGDHVVRRTRDAVGRLRTHCPRLPILVLRTHGSPGGHDDDRSTADLPGDGDPLMASLSWPYSEYVLVSRVRGLLGEAH